MAKKSKGIPTTANYVGPVPANSKENKEQERKWKAEDALRTCQRYNEITKDKQLMGDVKKLATEQKAELEKIAKTKAY